MTKTLKSIAFLKNEILKDTNRNNGGGQGNIRQQLQLSLIIKTSALEIYRFFKV